MIAPRLVHPLVETLYPRDGLVVRLSDWRLAWRKRRYGHRRPRSTWRRVTLDWVDRQEPPW